MNMIKAKVIDPTHLELSNPIKIENGKTVVVFVADADEMYNEHQEWTSLSMQTLQSACGEAEPLYEAALVRERNPEYGS